jgi:hypothetical protein
MPEVMNQWLEADQEEATASHMTDAEIVNKVVGNTPDINNNDNDEETENDEDQEPSLT